MSLQVVGLWVIAVVFGSSKMVGSSSRLIIRQVLDLLGSCHLKGKARPAPPSETHQLLSIIRTKGDNLCADNCTNKRGGTCTAREVPENLRFNGEFELHHRTNFCKLNSQ